MAVVHKNKKNVTGITNSVVSLFGFLLASMSNPPPFAVGASVAYPVDLLTSDSSEDDYLWGGASLTGNPRHGKDKHLKEVNNNGDEDDDQNVKSEKKPPVSKRKQNWNEKLGAATAHFEMDCTFLSLSTCSGPTGHIYRWLTAQQSHIEMHLQSR
jgi:hypothetical protein